MNWNTANNYCANKGMRLPTKTELICMCSNRASLPGSYVYGYYYWSSTASGGNRYYQFVSFGSSIGCSISDSNPSSSHYVKCVK